MERIVERPGALDIHKASVTACVRVWQGRELQERMAEFATTVHGLLALRDWLEALGVRQVAMEATGVYWKCAARRPVVSPAQPGGTRRDVLGPNGLPGSEK